MLFSKSYLMFKKTSELDLNTFQCSSPSFLKIESHLLLAKPKCTHTKSLHLVESSKPVRLLSWAKCILQLLVMCELRYSKAQRDLYF